MPEEINRYTRLKDLTKFGFDINWESLKDMEVIVAGIGGVGSLAAEMLTRCGIGKLDIIDLDTVSVKNLNRLFFRAKDIGKAKTKVAKKKLLEINPDVKIEEHSIDICSPDFEQEFKLMLKRANLLLMGLDNIPARDYVNTMCISHNLTYIDSGASRSGLGGYVHRIIPYKTACSRCPGTLEVGKQMADAEGEPCTASLPTTIALIASLQVEHALKTLLDNFGKIPDYISYNGLQGQFLYLQITMDPDCPVCGEEARKSREKQAEDVIPIKEIDPEIIDIVKDMKKIAKKND